MSSNSQSSTALDAFPSWLRRARERRGWSLGQLAAASGLTKEGIRQLELPTADPKVSTIAKLASALKVPAAELLGLEAQPSSRVDERPASTPVDDPFPRKSDGVWRPCDGFSMNATWAYGSLVAADGWLEDGDPQHGLQELAELADILEDMEGTRYWHAFAEDLEQELEDLLDELRPEDAKPQTWNAERINEARELIRELVRKLDWPMMPTGGLRLEPLVSEEPPKKPKGKRSK